MSKHFLILMLLLGGTARLLVLVGGAPSAPAPRPQPPPSPLNLTRPEAWPQAVEDHKEGLNQMARALIAIAEDEEQPGPTRKQAIYALGQINSRRSLTFLLDHVDCNLCRWKDITCEDTDIASDEDMAKQTPCKYILYRHADWNVVPLIMERLNQPRKEGELASYSGLLDDRLSGEGTAALIAAELSKQPEGARKQNLQTLKGWYQQHHHFLRNLKVP